MPETWIIGLTLTTLLVVLATNVLDAALAFVLAVLVFVFSGLIAPGEALASFANETLVGLMVLLQVSSVVEQSVVIPWVSGKIFLPGKPGKSIIRLTLVTAAISSFLNNTAVVAGLLGATKNNPAGPASKFLIPLSFAAILGGVITLIGTSTNLVVNSLVIAAGLPPLGFFDFTVVGIAVCLVAVPYLAFVVPKILPDRSLNESEPSRSFFVEAKVAAGSPLSGKTVEENGLRHLNNLFLAEIIRNDTLISPVAPDQTLLEGDSLVFTGEVTNLRDLQRFSGLTLRDHPEPLLQSNLQEVVIRDSAPIVGQKIRDARFRTRFDAAVVAVRRGDERISGKLGDVRILPGDHFVLAVGSEFARHENLDRNFILLSGSKEEPSLNQTQSWIALALFLGAIATYASGVTTLLVSMTVALLACLGLRLVKIRQLKHRLPLDLFIMVGCSFALAHVIEEHGLAADLGRFLVNSLRTFGPWGALAGVFLATLIVTEMVTNNAAAALLFPIGLAAAQELGADPKPFILAVAFAASGSFLTPIGYQTNAMVYSAGSYKFSDFMLAGLGITILYAAVVLGLLPLVFPFFP